MVGPRVWLKSGVPAGVASKVQSKSSNLQFVRLLQGGWVFHHITYFWNFNFAQSSCRVLLIVDGFGQILPYFLFLIAIYNVLSSVDAGKLSSPLRCDIIATTFTGKVVSFMHPIPQEESEALSDPVAMLNLQKKTVKATEMGG